MDRDALDGWVLTVMTLLLWGSIGTLAKASRVKWATFYTWYAVGIVAAGALLAASRDMGVVFLGLRAASALAISCGVAAGVCGCVGSMCFLSAIELVGVTLSYPVVMGLEMTVGTTLLYLVDSSTLAAGPLAAALVCVLGAVAFDALAQFQLMLDGEAASPFRYADVEKAPLRRPPAVSREMRSKSLGKVDFDPEDGGDDAPPAFESDDESADRDDAPREGSARSPTLVRSHSVDLLASARLLSDPVTPRSPRSPPATKAASKAGRSMRRGLRRAAAAGLLLSLWPVLEAVALEREGMDVYSFMVLFAMAHTAAVCVAMPARRPRPTPASRERDASVVAQVRAQYLKRPRSHHSPEPARALGCGRSPAAGVAAGVMWYSGAVFVFVAGTKIGVTVAVSVGRCSPVVAALWGLLVWREARGASARAAGYIAAMFVLYVAGIGLIAASAS